MTQIDQYRRWFDYEQEMHQKTLDSFATVPEAHRSDADFRKAVDLLAHVACARLMWLVRFGAEQTGPSNMFPQGCTVSGVAGDLAAMNAGWLKFLASLDDAKLSEAFDYTATDGKRFRNTRADILTQMFGHSLYHRGQIAQLIRRVGGTPAITDFVYWCREAI